MEAAEAAAKKHAAMVAYRRTFRGAYMKVPPAGKSVRERNKAVHKQATPVIKGGKNKFTPVFGATSSRF